MGESKNNVVIVTRQSPAGSVGKQKIYVKKNNSRQPAEYKGLCKACKNSQNCTYRRDLDTPVISCEEFELQLRAVTSPAVGVVSRVMEDKSHGGNSNHEKVEYRGLCMNCVNLQLCTFRKPESGVWCCEEYE